ncbi:MAG: hypothetical protein US70_C0007G0018 [Parcubacteria group bacterium GW2011_GWD2_38_11]|nr:MAG: hypothetical protein US70_C0007G0018 [Parcubacteria group bacterium GW2011_GWD2_38_11]
MQDAAFIPRVDEDGFLLPIDVFENFENCPSCNKLNLINPDTGKANECYRCYGPAKIAFEKFKKEVEIKNFKKMQTGNKMEQNIPVCKVCGKIH